MLCSMLLIMRFGKAELIDRCDRGELWRSSTRPCGRGLGSISQRLILFSLARCAPAVRTDSDNTQQVLSHLKPVPGCHGILNCLQLGRKEFDNATTLRTNHVVVMLMFVVMFVVRAVVAKAHLAREPCFRQQF